ncbi:phosphate acyltransferase PlsX [Planosporangium sp. 12N6]|uniref:phosphate acyltransferase PlsX n=1 Tax=Planosporangium spinosum TaxID=3402278 RepID=UPI003CE973B8
MSAAPDPEPRRPEPAAGVARIAVDLLGGDHAPAVVVDGALRACSADPRLHLLLVGPARVADEVLTMLPAADRDRVAVRDVTGVVGMADPPLRGVRTDTTVRAAAGALADGHADAVVSAGHSGAVVTAAVHALGRLRGIRRPALAATLPGLSGPVVLLDVGATPEVNAKVLVQHAALGAGYARAVHGITAPRVGLLSNGAEPGKGDRARRAAAATLAAGGILPGDAGYVGAVEGYDVPLGGPADVVVTDGFTGNVLLKGIEGAYALAGAPEPAVPRAAALLGVPGTVVICHGGATGADLASGIALAARLHRTGMVGGIAETMPPATAASIGEVST